ncbi:hypothetical protein [Serinicoccus profundi]|uniref:hypothetical protein n=1 Tax=Serinicoccus profundi TaxID=1078471 RepID=UPI000255F55F|nr:hypothetical protein [Serinicoccus profundi]
MAEGRHGEVSARAVRGRSDASEQGPPRVMTEPVSPRFDGMYVLAGLGWGALVGALMGAAFALLAVARDASVAAGGDETLWAGATLGLLATGMFFGGLVGLLPGLAAGLACATVMPWTAGQRSRGWLCAAFATAAGCLALGVTTGLLGSWSGTEGLGTTLLSMALVIVAPSVVGGVLMAWSTRPLRPPQRLA